MANRRAIGALALSISLIATATVMIVTSSPRCATAADIPILTLDSLIYDSTDIIEAHIVGPHPGTPDWVGDDVQVRAVYQGTMKPGRVCIVGGLPDYRKSRSGFSFGDGGLGAGDDVFLFLQPDTNPAIKPYVTQAFDPLSSGVRWIDGKQAVPFAQVSNPGPMVATNRNPLAPPAPLLDAFRVALKQRVTDVSSLRQRLTSPMSDQDKSWLLQILAERAKPPMADPYGDDHVLFAIADRINEFGDPEFAYKAMGIHPRVPVGLAFATPAGRDFLLGKLQAADTSDPMRVRLIEMIGRAGINHQSTPARGNRNSNSGARANNTFEADNAFYATRVMRLAVANADRKDFWSAFAYMLNFWMEPPDFIKDPQYLKDVSAAAAVLTDFYKNGANEQQQFDIESQLAQLGRAFYTALDSRQTSVVAIATDDSNYAAGKPPPPYVIPRYRWFQLPWTDLLHENHPTDVQTIGKSIATGREFIVDADPGCLGGEAGTSSSGPKPLPANLPAGHYRIFLRYFIGSRILSESHGFEIDQNGTPIDPPTAK
jgi:hypothetical protein